MQLSNELVNALPLRQAAQKTISSSLLHMPHLISERCLAGAVTELVDQTKARAKAGFNPALETISMPKNGFGPRPIGILSPEARTLYEALGERLRPHLGVGSREKGMQAHLDFGVLGAANEWGLIVDFDIAACYEYIDHSVLAEELVIQTLDSDAVAALQALLLEVYPRGIGIPQAMDPSHLLSDAYLGQIERNIIRAGYEVSRYADDFRVATSTWGEAYEAIERAVDIARKSGLVLAEGKTFIKGVWEIKTDIRKREDVLREYKSQAADQLRSIDFVQVGYDDFAINEVEPDSETVDFAALAKVIEDWVANDIWEEPGKKRALSALGAKAFQLLQSAPDRIPTNSLVEIAKKAPLNLFAVVSYLASRSEVEENWLALKELVELPRQSPWAKLWMIHLADSLQKGDMQAELDFLSWTKSLLDDRYETVRAEAAWLLSRYKAVTIGQIGELYVGATDITRTGLSASMGRLEGGSPGKEGKAIRSDSSLNKAAYDWGFSIESQF